MACNSCNSCNSGIVFPDFVINSCCNPCCRVESTTTGCGCGNQSCGCNQACGCPRDN